MGNRKKKHGKEKRKEKKSRKRKHSSSIDESSSEEEWVEKEVEGNNSSADERIVKKKSYKNLSPQYKSSTTNTNTNEKLNTNNKHEEWMSLSTSFLSKSNIDKKRERENKHKAEREKEQYNPRECSRELNPYWKNGGDGLPKFKKPVDDDDPYSRSYKNSTRQQKESNRNSTNRQSGWKKNRDLLKEDKIELKTGNYNQEPDIKESTKNRSEEVSTDDVLSEKELNALAAKVVKAEIMGNTKLATELKEKLEAARTARQNTPKEVLLIHTDSQGRSQPLKQKSDYGEYSGASKKKSKSETHKDGQRIRFYADDDKYSLKEMFENEKFNTVEDQNRDFIKCSSKIRKNDDLDDIFSDNIRIKESDAKRDSKNKERAIEEHKKVTKSLDNCSYCIQSEQMQKHLMVSLGDTAYISLPSFEPLTDGHCFIVPIRHVPCSTQLDENEWSDILDMRRALVRMYRQRDMDVIFFEVAKDLYKYPHMIVQCIPLPQEQGDLAPIYFKKAIDESETEWAMNKKLISLSGRDVRKAVPKGLPYFSVSFGMQEGYAHVIEDEKMFPINFAQEIIGGMMDLDHSKWRKPHGQKFEEQSKRVMEFSKEWTKFDCTLK